MKTTEILKSALMVFTVFSLIGCGRSSDGERAGRASTTGNVSGVGNGSGGVCGTSAGVIGRVFDGTNATSTGSFEERVKGLISADYDPQYIGGVVGVNGPSATCVTLEGALAFTASGEIITTQSKLNLKIYDSYADKPDATGAPAGAYPIAFVQAQSGQRQSDGSFTVTFADAVGSVTIEGRLHQSQVVGTIRYVNHQHHSGGAAISGELGAFAISASSFLK